MNETTIRLEHAYAEGREVPASELWDFPVGLIGVADLKRFALLEIEGAEPFHLLCAADASTFGLVLVDPRIYVPDYRLPLSPDDLAPLGTTDPQSVRVLVPVVLPSETEPFRLNLKAPILFDAATRRGAQRISLDESHALRFVPGGQATGAESCSS